MKKETLLVAVSNQKGGVGKSTILIALASHLNYTMGKRVAIVDCDSTQRSLARLRKRDQATVEKQKVHMRLLEEQRQRGCKIYPIVYATPKRARKVAGELASKGDFDIIFIDLPGSMDVPGVLQSLFNVDYVLTPIEVDNFVMDSSLSYASTIMKIAKQRNDIPLKDVLLFWTRFKKRSNVDVFDAYQEKLEGFGLTILKTRIPDSCRFKKELQTSSRHYFRCSLLPPPPAKLKGSGIVELADELIEKLKF